MNAEEELIGPTLCRKKEKEDTVNYLRENVKDILSEGLAETLKQQPENPGLFLSNWLHVYVSEARREKESRIKLNKFKEQRQKMEQVGVVNKQKNAIIERKVAVDSEGLTEADREAVEIFRKNNWVTPDALGELLNHLRRSCSVTGVYLSIYEDAAADKNGEPVAGLRYIASDSDHKFILNKCLLQDEGITWGALRDCSGEGDTDTSGCVSHISENNSAFTPRENSDESETESINEQSSGIASSGTSSSKRSQSQKKYVFIPQVLQEKKVHYWVMAAPGSYIAIPVMADDLRTPEAIKAQREIFYRQQQIWLRGEAQRKRQESAAVKPTAEMNDDSSIDEDADGDDDDNPADAVDSDPVALKPFPELPKGQIRFVLSMDTMGMELPLSGKCIQKAQAFVLVIEKHINETHAAAVTHQALRSMQFDEGYSEVIMNKFGRKYLFNDLGSYREALDDLEKEFYEKYKEKESEAIQKVYDSLQEQRDRENHEAFLERQMLQEQREIKRRDAAERRARELEENKLELKKQGNSGGSDAENGEDQEDDSIDTPSDSDTQRDSEHSANGDKQFINHVEPVDEAKAIDYALAKLKLDLFNQTIISKCTNMFRSLYREVLVAESPATVPVLATALILIGYTPCQLRKSPVYSKSPYNWDSIRVCLEKEGATSLIKKLTNNFNPEKPRQLEDEAMSILALETQMVPFIDKDNEQDEDEPAIAVIKEWVELALDCRRKYLIHSKDMLAHQAQIMREDPPEFSEPDFHFVDSDDVDER